MQQTQKRAILLIGNYPPPFGGIPTHLKYLAEGLERRGWSVHVLSDYRSGPPVERVSHNTTIYRPLSTWEKVKKLCDMRVSSAPVAQHRFFFSTMRSYLNFLAKYKFAKKICIDENVCVISAYKALFGGVLGAFLKQDLGTPFLTTIFGEGYSHPSYITKHARAIEYVAKYSDKWLSCSNHCAESIKAYPISVAVEPLLYGIDLKHFTPDQNGALLRQRLGLGARKCVAIFVGRMIEEMGLGVLLEGIKIISKESLSLHFLIVGQTGSLTSETERLANEFTDRITVKRDVPYSELPLLYGASDFAVAPSTNDRACLGLAIVEAMASGKPVIGSRVGGTAEVLDEGKTGILVKPGDSHELAQVMLKLEGDTAMRRTMGIAARARAEAVFDKETTIERFEEILLELVSDE